MTDVSKLVKLAGRLPGSTENNGLLSQVDDLLANPMTERLAVVWYDAPTEAVDHEEDARIPKIRIRRFEPMGEVGEATEALREMVLTAAERRTGRSPLPFDETDPHGVTVLSDGDEDGGGDG